MKNHDQRKTPQNDPIGSNEDPYLVTRKCKCGRADCDAIIIGMIRFLLEPDDESGEAMAYVHFPKGHIPSFIKFLEEQRSK